MDEHPAFVRQLARCQTVLTTVTLEYLRRPARKAFGRREARGIRFNGEGEALVLVLWSFAAVDGHLDAVTEVLGPRPEYVHDALAHAVLAAAQSPHLPLAPDARRISLELWHAVGRGEPEPAAARELLERGLTGLPAISDAAGALAANAAPVWPRLAGKAPGVPNVLDGLAADRAALTAGGPSHPPAPATGPGPGPAEPPTPP